MEKLGSFLSNFKILVVVCNIFISQKSEKTLTQFLVNW